MHITMHKMKRCRKTLLMMVLAIGVFIMGAAPDADAGFVLTIDDLSLPGVEVIIVDNSPVGTATAKGASTALDAFPGIGTITFIGGIGGSVFTVNVTTGVSKPIIGPAMIDLVSVNVTTTGAGTLEIMLTDTGFLNLPSTPGLKDSVGGVIAAGGTLTAEGFFDPGNVEFGATVATPILAFGPGAFSGVSSIGILPADQVTPFSLTKNVVITHTGAGATSFNNTLEVIPEPSTYLLFAVGILSIISASYRRRKKA